MFSVGLHQRAASLIVALPGDVFIVLLQVPRCHCHIIKVETLCNTELNDLRKIICLRKFESLTFQNKH